MGSLLSAPKQPAPTIPVAPPAATPASEPKTATNISTARSKAAAAAQGAETNPTGPQGLKEPAKTGKSTMLGDSGV